MRALHSILIIIFSYLSTCASSTCSMPSELVNIWVVWGIWMHYPACDNISCWVARISLIQNLANFTGNLIPLCQTGKKNRCYHQHVQRNGRIAPRFWHSVQHNVMRQNFGTRWRNTFWRMMTGAEISAHNYLALSRLNTLYIQLHMQRHGNQMHVVPSRPVAAADHMLIAAIESWPISCAHRYTWCCVFQNSIRWDKRTIVFMAQIRVYMCLDIENVRIWQK